MSARLELAEAYAATLRAKKHIEQARAIVAERQEYGDPELRDIDASWEKVAVAADELRGLVAEQYIG
jgi:hypothetical protein